MIIGFDAKRVFHNRSGLGNYSRSTLSLLSEHFPDNSYYLYTPSLNNQVSFEQKNNMRIFLPDRFTNHLFSQYWRSKTIVNQLKRNNVELYHGLSNEIPSGIEKSGIPSVVTIHDLIFLRYPHYYKYIDRNIYKQKFLLACQNSSRIIAISQQTKDDIVEYFKIPSDKIDIVYQSCDQKFYNTVNVLDRKKILEKYDLPSEYILTVGTIEERKNQLNLVKSLYQHKINIPLVVVGKPTSYANTVKNYIANNLVEHIYFIENAPLEDLPALYQMAQAFVYPSVFEGFGIPIIEALHSKIPVITTRGGCFPEAGGKSSLYVNPNDPEEIADAISKVLTNSQLRQNMIIDGYLHAQQFKQDKVAQNLMSTYQKSIR
jgi:glycosyltransferase involved in cell wall biosynthesis